MDQELLSVEFENIKSQLKSYLLRITTNVEDTEDIMQESFIKAQAGINSFNHDSTLKTWIFSIATNQAKDLLRKKKRWPENITDICKDAALKNREFIEEAMRIRHQSPNGNFEIKEHIAFCFMCISKSLSLEQQLALFLKDVYEFRVKEIAEILQLTQDMTKYYLRSGRNKMIEIFDGKCALINKEGTCHQCSELNGLFNPKQVLQEELVKIKMARDAEVLDKEELFDLRRKILQDIDPFESGAAELQLFHLRHNHEVMENYLKKNS